MKNSMRYEVAGQTYRGSLIPDPDDGSDTTYSWARIHPPCALSDLQFQLDVEGPIKETEHYVTTQSATLIRLTVQASDHGYRDTYEKRVEAALGGLRTMIEVLNNVEHDNNGAWAE